MSANYSEALSPYEDKGKCGKPELEDDAATVEGKSAAFAGLLQQSRRTTVICGAGISTSCGIPDFRGPNGVWTLEERGEKVGDSISFVDAVPSPTHRALVELERRGLIHFVVNQNIDGLNMMSGFPLDRLADVHGNVFVESCRRCKTNFIRTQPVPTMCLRPTGRLCCAGKCRGRLHDTVLDWESSLDDQVMDVVERNLRDSDLLVCLGTSLQIKPVGDLPRLFKRPSRKRKSDCSEVAQSSGGDVTAGKKLVVVNLQKTPVEKLVDLRIFGRVDQVFTNVFRCLDVLPILEQAQPVAGGRTVRLRSERPSSGDYLLQRSFVVDEPLLLSS